MSWGAYLISNKYKIKMYVSHLDENLLEYSKRVFNKIETTDDYWPEMVIDFKDGFDLVEYGKKFGSLVKLAEIGYDITNDFYKLIPIWFFMMIDKDVEIVSDVKNNKYKDYKNIELGM